MKMIKRVLTLCLLVIISLVGVIGGIIAHIYLSKKNNNIKEELTK